MVQGFWAKLAPSNDHFLSTQPTKLASSLLAYGFQVKLPPSEPTSNLNAWLNSVKPYHSSPVHYIPPPVSSYFYSVTLATLFFFFFFFVDIILAMY
jgi:hypothetical protein